MSSMCVALKFCIPLYESAMEAYKMLQQPYNQNNFSQSTTLQQYKQFLWYGLVSVTNQVGLDTPATTVNKIMIYTTSVIVQEDCV